MTNVSIPEVTMWKNSFTLAVFVPINLSIKFGLVSINNPRKLTMWTRYVAMNINRHNSDGQEL